MQLQTAQMFRANGSHQYFLYYLDLFKDCGILDRDNVLHKLQCYEFTGLL